MPEPRETHNPLQDEQGDWSFSRAALLLLVPNLLVLIWVDTLLPYVVPAEAYSTLITAITGFIMWAGGRAVARYLGPQVAGIAAAVMSRFAGAGSAPAVAVSYETNTTRRRPAAAAPEEEYAGAAPGGGG